MNANVKVMLKNVIKYDVIVALITAIGFFIVFKKYDYDAVIVLGLLIGTLNFIMNSYFSSYGMTNNKGQLFILLGAVIRVVFAGLAVVILYKVNKYYVIAFLAGYTLHYVAVVTYGLSIRKKGSA